MNDEREETTAPLPDDPKEQAAAILKALRRKAAEGDVEALNALRELRQEAVEARLRKELFGV